VGSIPRGMGIAVKIEDGSDRALAPVVVRALEELGFLDDRMLAELASFKVHEIKTWSGVRAGRLESVALFK